MGERRAVVQEHMVVEGHRPVVVRRVVELVDKRLVGMKVVGLDMALFRIRQSL